MGSSSTKAVGGVPVTQTAQDYTSFLGNAINSSGSANQAIQTLLGGGSSQGSSINDFLKQLQNYQAPSVQAPQSNLNLTQGVGTSGVTTPDISQPLSQLNTNVVNPYANNVNTTTSSNIDPNLSAALSAILGTQQKNDLNTLHESFTQNGQGAGTGTAGAYAQAVYQAQAAPQIANAIGQLGLQSRQLNQTDVGNALSQNAQNATSSLAAGSQSSNNLAIILSSLLSQGSLASQNQTANRGMDINQLSQALSQNQGNAANVLQAGQTNLSAAQSTQNNLLSVLQGMLTNNQQSQSGANSVLQQIFGGLNGANALGTTQAQTVQTPSFLSQLVSGLSSMAQAGGSLATGISNMKGA